MSGRKHSEETKTIMSEAHKGKTLSFGAMKLNQKYRILLQVLNIQRKLNKKISDAAKKIDNPVRYKTGENHPNYGKKKSKDHPAGKAISTNRSL